MPAMAAPLAAEKLGAWETWISEMAGPQKAGFDEMNSRHGLTEHRAYLQPMPDGNYLVLVIREGPGADAFMDAMASSDHEFDQWFMGSVAELHGIDPDEPPPPEAERRL